MQHEQHAAAAAAGKATRRTADDGQTNFVLFDLSVWPSSAFPRRTTHGLTMDRRILFFFTYLSGRRAPFRACGQRTDGLFVALFSCIARAISTRFHSTLTMTVTASASAAP